MSEENQNITPENVFASDVEKLAMNSNFGSLVFEDANKKLSRSQEWLKEIHDLGYEDLLIQSDIDKVLTLTNQLAEHLEWLRLFDIKTVENAKEQHDGFEGRVDNFYKDVYASVLMKFLPFLRDYYRRRENPSEAKVDEEVKKFVKLRSDMEEELKVVRAETEKIRTTGKNVGSAKGERAAVQMASHFDAEAKRYQNPSRLWFFAATVAYGFILWILFLLGDEALKNIELVINPEESINVSVVWAALISKLVILAALWYGLSFIIKNYNVNSHLSAVNRHRAAVARTLEDFIVAEQEQEKPRLSEMLQNATEAMFKHVPVGFVSKTEKENSQPILQIVNDLMGVGR